MKKNNNIEFQNKMLKYTGFIKVFTLLILAFMFSSCRVIASVFKAGMGFGIFAILAFMVAIVFVIMKIRKKQ